MVKVERTFDVDLIRNVIRHPRVYPYVTDDGCAPIDEYEPVMHASVVYLAVMREGECFGVFILVPVNCCTVEWHTCLLPGWPSREKLEAARLGVEWVWSETALRRIITNVPQDNPAALRFALAGGMTEFGRDPKSVVRSGVLMDRILLGMSRPETSLCQ